MIVCRSCGSHNADGDDFCGSCGEFLEWTGEKLAPQSAQPPIAESKPVVPEPMPAGPQPMPPVPQPKPAGPKPAGPKPAVRGFTPAVGGFSPAVTPSKPTVTSFKPASTEPPQRAAQALVTPPLPPDPDPNPPIRPTPDLGPAARKPQPQEMRPQAPVRRRPTAPTVPSPPTRELQPDDLICGRCGEGNPPTRRFCSRCGDSLQTATVVPTPPTPWWRKILALFERKVHPVGARPKRRSGLLTPRGITALLRRALLVALLLAGLLYAIVPSMRSGVNGLVRDRIGSFFDQNYVAVRPISFTASGELPDHPAAAVGDQANNTFWAAPGAQPTLVLEFERPTKLVRAIVFNGDGGGEDFLALDRARELHLVYSDGDRIIGASDVLLTDTPGEQQVELSGGDGATRVEIQVLSVYDSPQSPAMALSEIEFFERQ